MTESGSHKAFMLKQKNNKIVAQNGSYYVNQFLINY